MNQSWEPFLRTDILRLSKLVGMDYRIVVNHLPQPPVWEGQVREQRYDLELPSSYSGEVSKRA